ncbi:MAG: hypothetical protein GX979_05635 [Firmicutes bacterium]|nr:hypothetical protein [Bacillota bacterium]
MRYNHGMLEAKWRGRTGSGSISVGNEMDVFVKLIPKDGKQLDLENARLLLISHFLATITTSQEPHLSIPFAFEDWLDDARGLGLRIEGGAMDGGFDLAVFPRDFVDGLSRQSQNGRAFLCGRLLDTEGMYLTDLLPDFGVDACRIYFLSLGPLERDYQFKWHGLAGAHRFLARVWQLAQRGLQDSNDEWDEPQECLALRQTVQGRLEQRKPHTALAAIMGHLKYRSTLPSNEVRVIAELLLPFAPFLSAELLELVAAVQDYNGR